MIVLNLQIKPIPPNHDRCCYLDVVVGLAYRDKAIELYWLNNRSSRSYHARQLVLLTVQRCDDSKVLPSDNQHDSDNAFPQGGVGVEKIDPKNAHLTLSHGYPSPAVKSQQVRS
ncbi:unnamed protein product [Schistosoma curassoni]|uniref:Uncharacterized protein n=1 Tax=Schistosoma curassoni TaxID=6186 RepID=A0A183K7G4_9TREM|nr:unnamed protein product [Schistosoma curassoni]